MKKMIMLFSMVVMMFPFASGGAPTEGEMLSFSDSIEQSIDTGKMTVFKAAERGDTGFVGEYLADGGAVDRMQLYGGTMLYYAVRGRQVEMVRLLLDAGADATRAHEKMNWTPAQLLEFMADKPGWQDDSATGELRRLLQDGEARILETGKMADALLGAAWDGKAAVELTKRKPDWETMRRLAEAACHNHDADAFKAILAAMPGVPGNLAEKLQKNAYQMDEALRDELLHLVLRKVNEETFAHCKWQIREGQIYKGADNPNKSVAMHIDGQMGPQKQTLLMSAARAGNVSLCRLLLDNGAAVSLRDADGRTAADQACEEWGDEEAKRAIIQMLKE